jgi:hypothetical protein
MLPALLLAAAQLLQAQSNAENQAGNFALGMRSTISAFYDGSSKGVGTGAGGQFRIQIVDRVNTEWYGDVITSNILNKAHRTDDHIGWSIMYYVLNPNGFKRKITPYVIAGNCFDETKITINGPAGQSASRLSSEVQMGLGCSYNITPLFDLTLTTQYGLHLGNEIATVQNADGSLSVANYKNAGWEGHLLVSISANYKICKLWKPKK